MWNAHRPYRAFFKCLCLRMIVWCLVLAVDLLCGYLVSCLALGVMCLHGLDLGLVTLTVVNNTVIKAHMIILIRLERTVGYEAHGAHVAYMRTTVY